MKDFPAWEPAAEVAKAMPFFGVNREPVAYFSSITDSDRVTYALDAIVGQFRKAFALAAALHAEDNRWRIGEVVRDRPRDETYSDAERRVHAIMWQREPADVRERYAVRAVGLLLWMGGGA